MKQFDPHKPYGTVCGEIDGRHFEQDGAYYTSNGEPWLGADAVQQASVKATTEDKVSKTATAKNLAG